MTTLPFLLLAATCPGIPDMNVHCEASEHSLVIAADEADAGAAREALHTVRALAGKHFGKTPGFGVLSVVSNVAPETGIAPGMEPGWTLHMPFDLDRKPVLDALSQANLPAAQREAILAQIRNKRRGILRHELGHALFRQSLDLAWRGHEEKATYGTRLPDWLDEAAAILMEDAPLAAERRKQFQMLRNEGDVIPLRRFLSMEHPVLQQALSIAAGSNAKAPAQGRQRVHITAQEKSSVNIEVLAYYPQVLAFSDFLYEQSGNANVLAKLAAGFQQGLSLEDLLRKEGSKQGLPRSSGELAVQWQGWLDRHYPVSGTQTD